MVRSIKARMIRKAGRVAITFEVDLETWTNMGRSAKNGAHPDTVDYVAAGINTAFVHDEPPPAGPVTPAPDMDDDLPF